METGKNYDLSDVLAKKHNTEIRFYNNLRELELLKLEYKEAQPTSKGMVAGKIAFLCQDTQSLAEGLEIINAQLVAMIEERNKING